MITLILVGMLFSLLCVPQHSLGQVVDDGELLEFDDAMCTVTDLSFTLTEILISNHEYDVPTSICYPNLLSVDDDIVIQYNLNLVAVLFPQLDIIEKGLTIESNTNLAEVSFPLLSAVGNSLGISDNPMTSIAFPSLTSVERLIVSFNNNLTSLSLPLLNFIRLDYGILIHSNPSLIAVSFPSLVDEFGSVHIVSNNALTSISFSSATQGQFTFDSNKNLKEMLLPVLTLTHIAISHTALTTVSLPLVTRANVSISFNSELASFSLPKLRSAESVFIHSNSALKSLSVPRLTSVDAGLDISNNNHLTSISLPDLVSVNASTSDSAQLYICANLNLAVIPINIIELPKTGCRALCTDCSDCPPCT